MTATNSRCPGRPPQPAGRPGHHTCSLHQPMPIHINPCQPLTGRSNQCHLSPTHANPHQSMPTPHSPFQPLPIRTPTRSLIIPAAHAISPNHTLPYPPLPYPTAVPLSALTLSYPYLYPAHPPRHTLHAPVIRSLPAPVWPKNCTFTNFFSITQRLFHESLSR